jgi:hypothetical protein
MAFCFGFTMFSFRSLKFNDQLHRPLGRATLVVHAPFGLAWGLGLTASLARPLAWWSFKSTLRLLRVWRILGGGKMRQTLCVLSLAKIINKEVLFILRRRPKNF